MQNLKNHDGITLTVNICKCRKFKHNYTYYKYIVLNEKSVSNQFFGNLKIYIVQVGQIGYMAAIWNSGQNNGFLVANLGNAKYGYDPNLE